MPRTHLTFILLTCLAWAAPLWAGSTLTPEEQKTLDTWLKKYPDLRMATDLDCGCAENIQQVRRYLKESGDPFPAYHPFIATGDFNGDGVRDFAVAVVNAARSEHKFTLVIFNGPFTAKTDSPAFYETNLDLRGHGLFFGPPLQKPYRLVLSHFGSNTRFFRPVGQTYSLELLYEL